MRKILASIIFFLLFSTFLGGTMYGEGSGGLSLLSEKEKISPFFFTQLTRDPKKGEWQDESIIRFVSRSIPLSDKNYIPPDLVTITGSFLDTHGRNIALRKEAFSALEALSQDFAREFGVPLVIVSGYRSASYQQRLWDLGKCNDSLCAPPGYSEHQLGLAIDIFEATTEKDILANRAFARYVDWLSKHAHFYGFHQSYQKGPSIDAYEVEPWHWRYLGKEFATKLKKLDMSYSAYIEWESMMRYAGFRF